MAIAASGSRRAARARSTQRLESGNDGTRRYDLHAEVSAMFALPGRRILPRASTRPDGSHTGKTQEARDRTARTRRCRFSRRKRANAVAPPTGNRPRSRDGRRGAATYLENVALPDDRGPARPRGRARQIPEELRRARCHRIEAETQRIAQRTPYRHLSRDPAAAFLHYRGEATASLRSTGGAACRSRLSLESRRIKSDEKNRAIGGFSCRGRHRSAFAPRAANPALTLPNRA